MECDLSEIWHTVPLLYVTLYFDADLDPEAVKTFVNILIKMENLADCADVV